MNIKCRNPGMAANNLTFLLEIMLKMEQKKEFPFLENL
jgi:hypothetical protein